MSNADGVHVLLKTGKSKKPLPTCQGPLELCNLRDSARLQIAYLKSSFNFHSPLRQHTNQRWKRRQLAHHRGFFPLAQGAQAAKKSKQDISFHHLLWRPSTNETDTRSGEEFLRGASLPPRAECAVNGAGESFANYERAHSAGVEFLRGRGWVSVTLLRKSLCDVGLGYHGIHLKPQ